jgi:hypothetical protein
LLHHQFPSNSIKVDAVENIYTTGYFEGTVDFDPNSGIYNLISPPSNQTIFVSKLDASGNLIWAKSMGGPDVEIGTSIDIDTLGNVYTTGWFTYTVDFDPGIGVVNFTSNGDADIFISKLDSSGNFIWTKTMGGTGWDVGRSIAIDHSGNVFTTGNFRLTTDFDPGPAIFNINAIGNDDIYISKLDANGNFIWAKALSGWAGEIGMSVTTDFAGNVYTTGWFVYTVDFDPGIGVFNVSSVGLQDIFISKLDKNGNFLCVGTMGSTTNDIGYSISLDKGGNIYSTGSFMGITDFNPSNTMMFNITPVGNTDIFISKLSQSFLGTGLSENNINSNQLIIYPNPVSNILYFEQDLNIFKNSIIEIINTLGQTVLKLPYSNQIDVSKISKGIFYLKITTQDSQTYLSKFIKA